jgi:ABC-type taurine transport system ATPase subunit
MDQKIIVEKNKKHVVVCGPMKCGKTTFINILTGLNNDVYGNTKEVTKSDLKTTHDNDIVFIEFPAYNGINHKKFEEYLELLKIPLFGKYI